MNRLPAPLTPERWIRQIFQARAAAEGGIVRRGFHVAQNAGPFVIFCNQEPVRLLR